MRISLGKMAVASLCVVLFAALPAHANEVEAGFPAQPLWVSKTSAISGETIEIFTAVYNGSEGELKGTVVFTIDSERVGARSFELDGGASALVSVEWKAVPGEHIIAAAIEGASAAITQKETAAITVSVAEPPPPAPLANAAATASAVIADAARAATPVVTEVANTAYEFTESLRLNAVSKLEKSIGGDTLTGSVAGTSTANTSGFAQDNLEIPSGMSQIKQVAAAAALFALNSKGVFYPLFLLALLFLLYLLFRWALKRP